MDGVQKLTNVIEDRSKKKRKNEYADIVLGFVDTDFKVCEF